MNYLLKNKPTILAVTMTLFLGSLPSKTFGEDKVKEKPTNENISVNAEHSVIRNILAVSAQSGQVFCVEGASDTKALLDKKFSIKMSHKSIASFIESLEGLRFTTQKYTSSVLLRSPDVLKITDNPLNHTVKNFKFSGNHDAFIEKIRLLFPGLGPNVSKITGQTYSITYDIESSDPISIRDLLMLNAEKSGIMWKAIIKSKAPVFLIEDPETGKSKEYHGSAVSLSFRGA